TPPPGPNCTSSSVHCPPTASRPWSPSASTSGSTTATSGSPPDWMFWLMGWRTHSASPTGRRSGGDRPRSPGPPDDVKTDSRRWLDDPQGGDPMSISAHCGSCNREVLLGQLLQSSDGFGCPVCGFAFAPAYATVAPGVAARVMAAQATLVTALAELGSMTGDRLRLDRGTVGDPVTSTLPEVQQPALGR